MVRRYWVNFQCRGVQLIWIIIGQGPIVLAVGVGGGCLNIFLIYHFSFLSPFLWETTRYRLKYCLKGPLSPKQPTNQYICRVLDFSNHSILFYSILFNEKSCSSLSRLCRAYFFAGCLLRHEHARSPRIPFVTLTKPESEVIFFFMLNSVEHEYFPANKC